MKHTPRVLWAKGKRRIETKLGEGRVGDQEGERKEERAY